jgi:hypothetical protein
LYDHEQPVAGAYVAAVVALPFWTGVGTPVIRGVDGRQAVEKHYRGVTITDTERDEIRQTITEDLRERITTARQEIDRCQGVLEEVKEQERKLLNMHYEDRVSSEFFDDEQTRLRQRRQDAEALIARLNVNHDDVTATLDLALEIVGEDLHDLYQRADDTVRRLLNQALFKALYVCEETITAAELTGPFAALYDLHKTRSTLSPAAPRTPRRPSSPARCPRTPKPPRPGGNGGFWTLVRLTTFLVPPSGVEPGSTAVRGRVLGKAIKRATSNSPSMG